jgi:hypothetical protein
MPDCIVSDVNCHRDRFILQLVCAGTISDSQFYDDLTVIGMLVEVPHSMDVQFPCFGPYSASIVGSLEPKMLMISSRLAGVPSRRRPRRASTTAFCSADKLTCTTCSTIGLIGSVILAGSECNYEGDTSGGEPVGDIPPVTVSKPPPAHRADVV